MINLLKKLCNWLKSLFNRPSGTRETVATPSQRRLSDAEYESVLFALLAEVKKGKSWGSCQGFLMNRNIKPDELGQWISEKSLTWLDDAEIDPKFRRDLGELGHIASGKLGKVAQRVSIQLDNAGRGARLAPKDTDNNDINVDNSSETPYF